MQDEPLTPPQEPGQRATGLAPELPPPLPPAPRRSRLRWILLAAVLAFLLGGGLVAWLAWRGDLAAMLPRPPARAQTALPAPMDDVADPAEAERKLSTAESRMALLEERLARINVQADTASGNASRAEGMLIAFAARRAIDRGAPLGYIETQLRLRFADAQPNAVRTIIEAARKPVTIDELASRLDARASALARAPDQDSAWTRLRRELSGLFVIRRETTPAGDPQARLARARMLVAAEKIDEAIAEVGRLPGTEDARAWIADARRYAEVQHALDLIETTALFEAHRLHDGTGQTIDQPSPLAPPAADALPTPSAVPSVAPAI